MYFEVFQGVNNFWYWRLYSSNLKKIAFCSEGFKSKKEAIDGIATVKAIAALAPIKELALN